MSKMPEHPPAEWAPHACIWTAFPADGELWLENLAPAQREVAAMVRVLSETACGRAGDRMRVLVQGPETLRAADKLVGDIAEIVPADYGDIWLRDTGPIFVSRTRARLFSFNGWGGKYILDHDDAVGEFIAGASGAAAERWSEVLEGGAVEGDGEGTIITTRECLLNPNRNPGMTEAGAEAFLREALGAARVLWIERGLLNDHTDGHVDNIARFIAPGVVVCQARSDPGDPNAERLDEIAAFLSAQRDARGRRLQVLRIPSPGLVEGEEGEPVPASHMNFVIGNASVVVPTYGTATADAAVEALKPLFSDRRVVGLPSRHILSGGGSFHCITQQQPEQD